MGVSVFKTDLSSYSQIENFSQKLAIISEKTPDLVYFESHSSDKI